MPTLSDADYVALGRAYIISILDQEHAATWAEIQARSSERDGTRRLLVDVNHMVTARDELLASGTIVAMEPVRTRGGQEISVYHLPIVRGNARVISDAAARKRLLNARWIGWAIGGARYPHGLIGPAGNRVLSSTVIHDDLKGRYLPVEPDGGEVHSLFGRAVPGGPLDSGAFVVGRRGGVAGGIVLVPMEMKNLRDWLFPRAPQIYQLLDKASQLVTAQPDVRVAPLLVCRRRHHLTFQMAQDLGFLVVELHRQFMLPSAEAPPKKVEEVRTELGFRFLTRSVDPDPLLLRLLRETIPTRVDEVSARFGIVATHLGARFHALRDDHLGAADRDAEFMEMKVEAGEILGTLRNW